MDTISKAQSIITRGIKLLPDDAKQDFAMRTGIMTDEAIGNAAGMVNKDPEKEALLTAWSVQEANRVVTMLWREQLLTDELEKEYRDLPSMKEVATKYNEFTDARKARIDELEEQRKVIANEEKDLDIFKGVINGMKKEEAEKQYAEYQKQMQEAMRQGVK